MYVKSREDKGRVTFMLLLFVPTSWSAYEVGLLFFRYLGALTFLAWPIVAFVAVMGLDDPSKGIAAVIRFCLVFLLMAYPYFFCLIWLGAQTLKEFAPAIAFILTMLPATVVWGGLGYYKWNDHKQSQQRKRSNAETQERISRALQAGQYREAFSFFNDPSLSEAGKNLERSSDFDLIQALSAIPKDRVDATLIEELIRYLRPYISTGYSRIHMRSAYSSNLRTDISEEVLKLLFQWRQQGVEPSGLPYAQRWFWNRLEIYQDQSHHDAIWKMIRTENALLGKILGQRAESSLHKIQITPNDLNRRGLLFGTPLHAMLVDFGLNESDFSKSAIRFLVQNGAVLDASELYEGTNHLLKMSETQ